MIKVNLLPETKRKKMEDRSLIILFGFLCFAFFVSLFAGIILFSISSNQARKASEAKTKVKRLEAKVDELKPQVELNRSELDDLQNKKDVIELLMGKNRIRWANVMDMLADVIPRNVYLYQFTLEEHREKIKVQTSSSKKKKGKTKDKIIVSKTLQLQGFTNSDSKEDDLTYIASFMNKLKTNQEFQNHFTDDIVFSSTKKVVVAGKVINLFELNLELKSKPAKQAAAKKQISRDKKKK